MKKIASLFLIAALFYNVLGFYMMFAEQQQQVWVNANDKTCESNFEIINVNINPYAYIADSGFENANEDIVIKNKTYHVFKSRIQNNVLKLYCLRQPNKNVISNDLKKIVDCQLYDTNSNKENSGKKLIKSFSKDFISQTPFTILSPSVVILQVTVVTYGSKSTSLSGYLTINYPPPNMV